MSNITNNQLTKEQLFACLEHDGIKLDANVINKAKNGDGEAFHTIGFQYKIEKKDYSKSMSWYRLAVNRNFTAAYNSIGVLYDYGQGVSQDYLTGMDYYLKATESEDKIAIGNIGIHFRDGLSVSVDKYKALEWFIKSGEEPENIKTLNEEGVHLREEDKKKSIRQLINETEEIRIRERMKKEYEAKSQFISLMNRISSNKKDIQQLRSESQQKQQQIDSLEQEKQQYTNKEETSKQLNNNLEQQLKDKMETINSLNTTIRTFSSLVQSKDNEIDTLRENSQLKIEELKRKIEELERGAQLPTSSTDNYNNNNSTTDNILNSISNSGSSDTHSINADNIGVKIDPEYEDSHPVPCQIRNKKRKCHPMTLSA